jgi:hypothetical protein
MSSGGLLLEIPSTCTDLCILFYDVKLRKFGDIAARKTRLVHKVDANSAMVGWLAWFAIDLLQARRHSTSLRTLKISELSGARAI